MTSSHIPHLPRPSRISATLSARLGPPALDPAVVREVLDRYDLHSHGPHRNLRLARRSLNVAVATDRGTKVVKRYRPQWTEQTVSYGHSIVTHLREVDVPAVRLARTPQGATWTGIDGHLFAVFDFIPGRNYSVSFLRRSDRLRLTATAGRALARLHRCLDGFVPNGAHHLGFASLTGPRRRDLSWHAAKLDELRHRSTDLTTPDVAPYARRLVGQAGYLLDALAGFERALADVPFPRIVIHGDYGLHNLIFPRPELAVAVDFELARLDWRLNDLISALGKHRYRDGHYDLQSMVVFLRAYAAAFPLSPLERHLLPHAWRLYKLQAAVQYWNSYFETSGPPRKLASALDAIGQADEVLEHPEIIRPLIRVARESAPDSVPLSTVVARTGPATGGFAA